MFNSYKAALYMRLSKDDGSKESASISNQRKLLTDFANTNKYEISGFYVDDGYSGTNFDRPAFRQLLADIRDKKINMVICKDLSRLGRDYVQTGQLTENYFPRNNVRFIAINDDFDTDIENEIAPFRNVINEMYARDISKKIKSAFKTKMLNGEFIGNFAPYGYKKSQENKNKLEIDSYSGEIVKFIFAMALENTSYVNIAAKLNEMNVLSPSAYRQITLPTARKIAEKWSVTAVSRILRNPIYTGNLYQGKTKKLSFKSNVLQKKDKNEWITAIDTHSPLVSLQNFLRINNHTEKHRISSVFGVRLPIFCADCGNRMSVSGKQLCCSKYKSRGKIACSNHYIKTSAIEHLISEICGNVQLEDTYLLVETITVSQAEKRSDLIWQQIEIHLKYAK